MICESFEKLTPKERVEYVGELLHAVQSDNSLFEIGKEIIRLGNHRGLFEGVVIFPPVSDPQTV